MSCLLWPSFGESAAVATQVADLREPHPRVIVRGLDFSPDASRLAIQSDGEKINIWDWRHERVETTLEKPQGAKGAVASNPIRYSPDGRLLAACDSKAVGAVVIRLWNVSGGSIAKDIVDPDPGGCNAMDFTPDGRLLIRAVFRVTRPSEMIAYAVGTWSRQWSFTTELAADSIAVSPDGRLIALAGLLTVVPKDHGSPRFDAVRRERTIDLVTVQEPRVVGVIKSEALGPPAWSPDGTRVALAGNLFVEIFAAPSGQPLVHARLEKSGSMHVRYTPDGRYFVESDLNGSGAGLGVNIWDGSRQKLLQQIPGDIGNISISKDGKYLALGGIDHTTVWELK
jgi:WD40 repeat protein